MLETWIKILINMFFKKPESIQKPILNGVIKETEILPTPIIPKVIPMKLSDQGLKLIAKHEGLSLKPYLCPAGIPTIGYGNTYYENGQKVMLNDPVISKERAEELLKNIVKIYEDGVLRLVTVSITQNQFDALVSFSYNVGLDEDTDQIAEGLGDSTLLKLINKKEFDKAALEFPKWNKSNGKILSGLIRRRKEEMELFLKTV